MSVSDVRFFDPRMPWAFETVAREYSGRLTKIGKVLFWANGALFFIPLSQGMALGMAGILLAIAIIPGRRYNDHVDEFIKLTSWSKLIVIFAPAWRYLVMTALLLGVGMGLSEWGFFGEQKQIFIALFVSGGLLELVNHNFSK